MDYVEGNILHELIDIYIWINRFVSPDEVGHFLFGRDIHLLELGRILECLHLDWVLRLLSLDLLEFVEVGIHFQYI